MITASIRLAKDPDTFCTRTVGMRVADQKVFLTFVTDLTTGTLVSLDVDLKPQCVKRHESQLCPH